MASREIGLHLRLKDKFLDLAHEAIEYNLKSFQFFLTLHTSGNYININSKDRNTFIQLRQKYFSNLYIHSSYWINLGSGDSRVLSISKKLFKREINRVQQLEINYIVLHSGSYKNSNTHIDPQDRIKGICTLAKSLNSFVKNISTPIILLENTAHEGKTIGGNLDDFKLLREYIDFPEKICFCLDTAHAHAYGYLVNDTKNFINTLENTLGLSNIKLIHINDLTAQCGSRNDTHAIPGKGTIGIDALKNLINTPELSHIPLISEPPRAGKQTLIKLLQEIREWGM